MNRGATAEVAVPYRNIAHGPQLIHPFHLGEWNDSAAERGKARSLWRKGRSGPGEHAQPRAWNELFASTKGRLGPVWCGRLFKWFELFAQGNSRMQSI